MKALEFTSVRLPGRYAVLSAKHLENASYPMNSTPKGMVIDSKFSQYLKASLQMVLTELGIVTDVRLRQSANALYCSHCGVLIGEDEDYGEVNGEIVCNDCIEHYTSTCDRCGETIWTDDSYGDEYTTLCSHCYHNHYTRCSCCDRLLHEDDAIK